MKPPAYLRQLGHELGAIRRELAPLVNDCAAADASGWDILRRGFALLGRLQRALLSAVGEMIEPS